MFPMIQPHLRKKLTEEQFYRIGAPPFRRLLPGLAALFWQHKTPAADNQGRGLPRHVPNQPLNRPLASLASDTTRSRAASARVSTSSQA